jgi:hypothetical protein
MLPRTQFFRILAATLGVTVIAATSGCPSWSDFVHHRPAAAPLGTLSDPVWQNQEFNAEKSDFVVHEHEFVDNAEFLNTRGEDHLKQIAARLTSGQDAQVLVERSKNFARPDTEYKYRVNTNPEMDMRRRDVVVRCLMAMKIADADSRVVVAPDLAPEYRAGERAATDQSEALGNWNDRSGGYGGGDFGGWGGGWGGF